MMRWIGKNPSSSAVIGHITGAAYPFHRRQVAYVDARDVPFLLGQEIDLA